MDRTSLLQDARLAPYWWDRTPRPTVDPEPLPARVDVAVIGSGYTGLHAALQTARAGRQTLVLDAENLGWGCSTRNGGQVSTSIKPDYAELSRRHGPETARRILEEGDRSLAWLGEFIEAEGIDCDYRVVGHFHAAHSPGAYDRLAKRSSSIPEGLDGGAYLVPKDEQKAELGTDSYYGGMVFPRHAAVDPAAYHRGLLERAVAAGATAVPWCGVSEIERRRDGFRLATQRGEIIAREVVVATNGYTGPATPWLRRRVIPIGSYVIATESLPEDLVRQLMPRGRTVTDTRRVVYYYRPSPDGRRILFGGRVTQGETDASASGALLHAEMSRLFPELRQARISHSWCGFVAYTFDELMHIGERDGLHYAMGYCGSGVAMASYLGMRLGRKVLREQDGAVAFDDLKFSTRPFYSGRPWFLAPAVWYYRMRDRLSR